MGELSKDNLLRSWKEIAAYLGVDVRTCYRWEDDRGMPVHRAESAEKKSPVFAYKDELDAWFREAFKSSHPSETGLRPRRLFRWVAGGSALLAAAGGLLYVLVLKPPPQPADFRIEGSVVYVLDKHKRELWHRDTNVEDLQTESFYRSYFQVVHTEQMNVLPSFIMRDINGDGDTEVLFAIKRMRDQTGEGMLYCFDRKGRKLWSFKSGKELKCGSHIFPPDFRIAGFYVRDLEGDGRLEVFVESFHAPDWPCQLAVLDATGRVLSEFWNAGYLRELVFHDIDRDGREEMIICGVNNEYRGGCLAVFDARDISGSSPQSGAFACEGLKPGSMIYYVTMPLPDVSLAKGNRVDGMRLIEITGNDWIRVTGSNGVMYEFDFGLKCAQVTLSNGFQMDHFEMRRAGAITSVLDDNYKADLRNGIRYWDGSAWVPTPTKVKR